MLPSPERVMPPYLEFHPMERKHSHIKHDIISSNVVCSCAAERRDDSDTSLHLGYYSVL